MRLGCSKMQSRDVSKITVRSDVRYHSEGMVAWPSPSERSSIANVRMLGIIMLVYEETSRRLVLLFLQSGSSRFRAVTLQRGR
jgi:hypothetical protein